MKKLSLVVFFLPMISYACGRTFGISNVGLELLLVLAVVVIAAIGLAFTWRKRKPADRLSVTQFAVVEVFFVCLIVFTAWLYLTSDSMTLCIPDGTPISSFIDQNGNVVPTGSSNRQPSSGNMIATTTP